MGYFRVPLLVVVVFSLFTVAACEGDTTVVVDRSGAPDQSPTHSMVESDAAGSLDLSITCLPVVDPSSVEVSGDLDPDERATVDWALGRFAQAGLRLPEAIAVGFDPTRVECEGELGRCDPNGTHPPEAWVCEPAGDSLYRTFGRRVTLLHEFAHMWHWSLGTGDGWLDLSHIVGGTSAGPDRDVEWSDRSEERVAMALTWGLLDQKRRPVGSPTDCVALYDQFRALTGVDPLAPLDPGCVPDRLAG